LLPPLSRLRDTDFYHFCVLPTGPPCLRQGKSRPTLLPQHALPPLPPFPSRSSSSYLKRKQKRITAICTPITFPISNRNPYLTLLLALPLLPELLPSSSWSGRSKLYPYHLHPTFFHSLYRLTHMLYLYTFRPFLLFRQSPSLSLSSWDSTFSSPSFTHHVSLRRLYPLPLRNLI
jgi:hypothetical protein